MPVKETAPPGMCISTCYVLLCILWVHHVALFTCTVALILIWNASLLSTLPFSHAYVPLCSMARFNEMEVKLVVKVRRLLKQNRHRCFSKAVADLKHIPFGTLELQLSVTWRINSAVRQWPAGHEEQSAQTHGNRHHLSISEAGAPSPKVLSVQIF